MVAISMSGTCRKVKRRKSVLLLVSVIAFFMPNAYSIAAEPVPAKTLQQLARLYAASGDYSKAQCFAERALTLAEEDPSRKSLTGLCLLDLAYYSKEQGDLTWAESLCRQALSVRETSDVPEYIFTAAAFRILSDIHRRAGDLDRAFEFIGRAIEIISSDKLPEHYIAPYMVDLAVLSAMRGDGEKARKVFSRAMKQIHKSYGPNHFYTATVLAAGLRLDQ